ncbi:MAG: hypothetical protein IPN53_20095 [Comamonadaceae bacterium]|nr:hypothetical protein [Comamonadaceae bacterium]
MTTTMTSASAYFRQYCAIGLDDRIVMPTLMQAMHQIVPSNFNVFWWAGESGEVSGFHTENPNAIPAAKRYMSEFANKREMKSVSMSFGQHVKQHNVRNAAQLGSALFESDFYQELLKPVGIRTLLRASVKPTGRPGGSVMLTRAPGERPFSAADERRLESVLPYLAHALAAPRDTGQIEYADCGDQVGMLIVSLQGKVEFANEQGRLFLRLAQGSEADELEVFARLTRAVQALDAIQRGTAAPPPAFRLHNASGVFQFRCYNMESTTSTARLACVWITRLVPKAIKQLATIQTFGLPHRLTEYCAALARGLSHSEASRLMGISLHTGKSYFDSIRDKLGVASREELLKRIQSDNP